MPIPTPDTRLFTASDLTTWLRKQSPISEESAAMTEQVVWGWLKPALGLPDRPSPVPAEVFSWAIELGAIAHENPAGLSSQQLGNSQKQFSAERREQILERAGRGTETSSGLSPRGNFPSAPAYPDSAW